MLLTILLKISIHGIEVMCLWCCCLYLKLYRVVVIILAVKAMRSVHLIISSKVWANLISSFQKGIFDKISMYIRSVLGGREETFLRRRGLQLLHKKRELGQV